MGRKKQATMTWPVPRKVPAVALVLVGLTLVACLPASAEVPSAGHHNCAVITGEQFTLHKVSPRSLGAVAINPAVALIALWPSFCSLPAPTEHLKPFALSGDLSSRSPPTWLQP